MKHLHTDSTFLNVLKTLVQSMISLQFYLAVGIYFYFTFSLPVIDDSPKLFTAAQLHFIGNTILAVSGYLALHNKINHRDLLLGLFCLASVSEVGQYFLTYRVFDMLDLLTNYSGLTTGIIGYLAFWKFLNSKF